MGLTVSTARSRDRPFPWYGAGALIVGTLVFVAAASLVPTNAPWWIIGVAAVGSLLAGVTAERTTGSMLDRGKQRRRIAEAVDGLQVRAPRGLATLLSPHHPVALGMRLLGRDQEIADLLDWCAGQGSRFRLITGSGGVGKTRLGVELQRRLRDSGQEWETLFLELGRDDGPRAVSTLREHAGPRPVLVVVDHADNRSDLRRLLADAFEDSGTIRVLMLARRAGNWWDRLTSIPDGLGADLLAGYSGVALPDLDGPPQAVVDNAASGFAAYLGAPAPRVRIEHASHLRALDLTMIGLVAVLDVLEDPSYRASTRDVSVREVFTELLRHEAERHWQPIAREMVVDGELTNAMQRVLVAAVALLGAPDESSTNSLAQRVIGTFPDEIRPDAARVTRWLRKAYPVSDQSEGWVAALAPDRLAEHLVVQTLTVTPQPVTRRVEALLENLIDDQAVRAMTLLSRAATDPIQSDDQQREIRNLADHLAGHLPPDPMTVAHVLGAIPRPSETMGATALELALTQLDLLDTHSDTGDGQIAEAARKLGVWFADRGRYGEAFRATQRAVAVYEQLADTSTAQYEPQLAGALLNLGAHHRELGRYEDALHATQRSIEHYEALAQRGTNDYQPELAQALGNLGVLFSDLMRLGDAMEAAQRAADAYEKLARTEPARYEPKFAGALNNLGIHFAEQQRPEEALSTTRRAVAIYEGLAVANPDRYVPDLARALDNLGRRLLDLDRPDEAVAAVERALNHYERLAQDNPSRYEAQLAEALEILARSYFEVDRPLDALRSARRAIDLYAEAVRTNPVRYEPDLARTLTLLGTLYNDLGWPDQALPITQSAVEVYERLAIAAPDQYEPKLAMALNNLGVHLTRMERQEEAVTVLQRSVTLLEHAAGRGSAWYRKDLHQEVRDFLADIPRRSG